MSLDRTLPDPAAEPTITLQRAAAILGVSTATAYRSADKNEIPTVRVGGRRLVLTLRFLAQFGLAA